MKKLNLLIFISALLSISLKPTGYLNDFAGILSEQQKQEIEERLKEIENKTTNEIAVVIINSLENKSIEDYANELFNSWGIGKKGKNNGVLILIALKEKKLRIEVGYGLEPYLPDSICGRIIREIIVPYFKKNDFYTGIKNGIEKIYEILDKGDKVLQEDKEITPPKRKKLDQSNDEILQKRKITIDMSFLLIIIVLIMVSLRIFPVLLAIPLAIVLLWFVLPFCASLSSDILRFSLEFTLIIFMIVSMILYVRYINRLKRYYGRQWRRYLPSYLRFGGGFYSSGGGGFSGSFGGFGGGISGGGGASGSW
jgi:uncharacterized protein